MQQSLSMHAYNRQPVEPPAKYLWFLNGDICRVHHSSRSAGIVTLYNTNKDCFQTILKEEWIKKRRRAYSVTATARLLNRHKKKLPHLVKIGLIPKPTIDQVDQTPRMRARAYWSEDQVREIRDILAMQSHGPPRKDKLISNFTTPSKQELSRRMGDGLLQYTKTPDGRVIPVWDESI